MAFNNDPATYDTARPGYPDELYQLLADRCGLAPGVRILEIGPGTGQASGPLLAKGAHVVAVEPGEQLAAVLSQRFPTDRLEVVVADFEQAKLVGRFDLVVAATSFHWVDLPVAMPKLAKLVRPGGWLAIWWNVFQDPDTPTPFRDALDGLYAEVLPELSSPSAGFPDRLRPESWTRDLQAGDLFGPVETHFLYWSNPLTPQRARNLWATFSNIINLDADRRTLFLDGLETIVRDRFAGHIDDPCVTAVYLALRRPEVSSPGEALHLSRELVGIHSQDSADRSQ
jgi:SAM-dependent methyltransferase